MKELFLPEEYGIGAPIMTSLLDSLGRPSLLPNLRLVSLGEHEGTLNESDCFFLCSTLKHLKIQGQGIDFVLPRITQAAPSIQHLELLDSDIPPHLLPLLKGLRFLKSLQTKNEFIISPVSFASSFPFAEHLTKWCASSIIFRDGELNAPTAIEFPSLTRNRRGGSCT